jgi:Na+-translocating ferredoxin:NAD+ oxidoreductase subunit B
MNTDRREFLATFTRGAGVVAIGGVIGALIAVSRARADGGNLWQIDPAKCIQCGKCATNCVLSQSAVRCFHAYAVCGYCDLCTGFFEAEPNALNTGAENQTCPTAAIKRRFVEDPYFEYQIDRALCLGCAKCVKGCTAYGNGSLYLQIDHEYCEHCNRCAIAMACPSGAIGRVPADEPYVKNVRVRGT